MNTKLLYHQVQVRWGATGKAFIEPHILRYNYPTRMRAAESKTFKQALKQYPKESVRIHSKYL